MKFTHNIGVGGMPITINWEVKEVIEQHDSGCAAVLVEGQDDDGVNYEAEGTTQSGELVDVDDNTIQGDLE